jgi:hypothetical protein
MDSVEGQIAKKMVLGLIASHMQRVTALGGNASKDDLDGARQG